MLRRQNVAVDGDSPTLVHAHLGLAGYTVEHRCELGAKKEDIYTAKRGNLVKSLGDGCLEDTCVKITDEFSININDSATLCSWLANYGRNVESAFGRLSPLLWVSHSE